MKISYFLALLAAETSAFTSSSFGRHQFTASSSQRSGLAISETANDSSFSAFADALENDSDETFGKATTSNNNKKSWQAKLDDLLNPKTDPAERQVLLSELLNSNDEIRDSVLDALANRKIDPILTPTAARLQDGTRAVVRQIANDILPELQKGPRQAFPPTPESLSKVGNRLLNLFGNQLQKGLDDFQQDLSDPLTRIPQRLTKQTEDLAQEVKNVFLETPEGLEEPPYSVAETCDLYELRDYEEYTVAATNMAQDEEIVTAGNAFNTLAAYLLGANKDSQSLTMTTPVTTTSLGEMRFYLRENSIPEPLAATKVDILQVPAARLAVRKFAGFATDGEIARQKDTLLRALEMDGVELDVPHGSVVPHVVFQYNPPYTLPIVRRNEIAVPVRGGSPEQESSLQKEWNVDDTTMDGDDGDDMADLAPSD